MDGADVKSPTAGEARRQLDQVLGERSDVGITRIIAGWLLEAPSPFDPGCPRKVKPGVLIILSYLALMGAASALFNWT
jgi:hypothetical protein